MQFPAAIARLAFVVIFLCCLLTVLADEAATRQQQQHKTPQKLQHSSQHHEGHANQQEHQHRPHHHHHHHRAQLPIKRQPQPAPQPPKSKHQASARQPRKLLTKSLGSQVEVIDVNAAKNASTRPPAPTTTAAPLVRSTKLRRLSDDEFQSNRLQQTLRLNGRRNARDEWAYNTYNIYTNTYGSALPSSGKGDDNSDDVEFVSATGSRVFPEWPRRGGYLPPRRTSTSTTTTTTVAPPALVPAKRGYPVAPVTDSPAAADDNYETNTISRNPSNMDPRDMEKRHICVQQRTITMPVRTTEVYTRPTWKHVNIPCQPQTHAKQMCTRVQMVHEQAYRNVIRHKSAQQVTYDCCSGWMRESQYAEGCMKPICSSQCQNGGTCQGPDSCSCPAGFTGRYCEQDVDECRAEKPCDHMCTNTMGSYICTCHDGFTLQADQQSCKKTDLQPGDAFEARDLENEVEPQEDVTARLQKIEKQLANERVQSHELQKSLQSTYTMVDSLKNRLVNLEKQQLDYNRLQSNLYNTENRTMKLEGMLNLLLKCRNTSGPTAQCP